MIEKHSTNRLVSGQFPYLTIHSLSLSLVELEIIVHTSEVKLKLIVSQLNDSSNIGIRHKLCTKVNVI